MEDASHKLIGFTRTFLIVNVSYNASSIPQVQAISQTNRQRIMILHKVSRYKPSWCKPVTFVVIHIQQNWSEEEDDTRVISKSDCLSEERRQKGILRRHGNTITKCRQGGKEKN